MFTNLLEIVMEQNFKHSQPPSINSYEPLGLKDGSTKLNPWAFSEKQNILNKKITREAKLDISH